MIEEVLFAYYFVNTIHRLIKIVCEFVSGGILMKKHALINSFFVVFLLMGCSMSIEELSKTTINEAEQAFNEEPIEPNEETELFSFYLPNKFQIEESHESNLILEKNNQSYILFVNQNEMSDSKVSFEALSAQYNEPFILESFEQDNKFGYLFVDELNDKEYEVTVGIGGTKLSTTAKPNNISDDVKEMMNIVSSVEPKDS